MNTQSEDEEEVELPPKPIIRGRNDSVLKLLNSNSEDPYLVWDNSTRAELLDFVDKHRNSNENTVNCKKHHKYIWIHCFRANYLAPNLNSAFMLLN